MSITFSLLKGQTRTSSGPITLTLIIHLYVLGSIGSNTQPVRLANGRGGSPYEGRVAIYHNGRWGTVCDNNWSSGDGRVVCRQLGFPDYEQISSNAYYGQGADPIWLDMLGCYGNENRLDLCAHSGWENNACTHQDDAGVRCKAGKMRCLH